MEQHFSDNETYDKFSFRENPLKRGIYENCNFNNCDFPKRIFPIYSLPDVFLTPVI